MNLRLTIFHIFALLLLIGGSLPTTPLVLSSALHAAEPVGWEGLGLYGGQINAIAIDPTDPNIMFAGSWYGDGLFKSSNGGTTWESVEGFRNELVVSIAFDPQNHRTIWVAAMDYIFKSEDGGSTWELKLNWSQYNRFFFSVAIDPINTNTIYVGTTGRGGSNNNARVYETTDGGGTWQQTSLRADHNVVDLAINPQNPQEIWAVTGPEFVNEGSIYRSQNGGGSWQEISPGLYRGWFWFVVINPQDPNIVFVGGENGVFRTKDGGVTWSQLQPIYWCKGFALAPENSNTVYASWIDNTGGVISKSTDGGDNWVTHSINSLHFLDLIVDHSNPQILFGGDSSLGVYKSTDAGQNWQATNKGIRANHVFDSAISQNGKLLVGSFSGVHLKNGGGSWERIYDYPAHDVAFSPENENTVYAGFDLKFGKSDDSGQNWYLVDINSSSGALRVVSISISTQNPDTIYLGVLYASGNKGEIYRSTDGGDSVSLIKSFNVPVNAVTVNPMNSQVVYAGTGMFYNPVAPGAVYKSIDGGETWEETGLTGRVVNVLALDQEDPDTVYAGCGASDGSYSGLFKSNDGGTTWEEKDFGIPENAAMVDLGIDPDNRSILYAATERCGTYTSYNGGDYWTLLGLSDYWLYDILVSPSSSASSEIRKISESELLPSSDVYAGSGSGMLEFTGSGIGVVTGMITEVKTNLGITGAGLSTDTGGVALSLDGYYIMVLPAGICQVKGKAEGYLGQARRNVSVTAGEEATVNLRLTPLPTNFTIEKFESDASGPVAVGNQVKFTAQAEGENTLYYQFWVASGYGTTNYGNWSIIQQYSTNNSCYWTPIAEGNYVIVAWVTDDSASGIFHQVGMSVSTANASSSPIQVTEFNSSMAYPVSVGVPITFTAEASGGSGPMKYQFWVTDGTQWQSIRDYSTNTSCTWTPTEAGCYIIVVWASDAEATQSPPIAGWTCVVE